MAWMLCGFAILFALQQMNASPRLVADVTRRFGGAGARLGLGALALAALALILAGHARAAYTFVWLPPAPARTLILPLMFMAFILVAASVVPSNLRRFTRRPALWGVVLWSAAHLLAKENLAAILLFAGFGLLALAELGSLSRRGVKRSHYRQAWMKESLTIALGGVVFIVLFYAHAALFGASPAMLSRPFG
ncbi:MAG: NnrU family protein [Gammaproteobacteria bacterium]|jgi:uncharacterized membrane protein